MFHILNRILTSTYSPLLFPEYIVKVERIFNNTNGYTFLAEVSCESLFKIIWYIKSNKSEYQTNKFLQIHFSYAHVPNLILSKPVLLTSSGRRPEVTLVFTWVPRNDRDYYYLRWKVKLCTKDCTIVSYCTLQAQKRETNISWYQ